MRPAYSLTAAILVAIGIITGLKARACGYKR
jgi:hypothetical protein